MTIFTSMTSHKFFSFSLYCISSINEDLDSSLLDVSTDIIDETPRRKPSSPKSFAEDVVKCLAIATPGRVDAAGPSNHNITDFHHIRV